MLKRNIKIKNRKKEEGQSTVEYIILVAAIIAILIVFLRPGGVFQNAFNQTLSSGTNGMADMANRLQTSRPQVKNP